MEEVEEECDESSTRGMLIFFVSFLSFFLLLLLLEGLLAGWAGETVVMLWSGVDVGE